MNSTRRQLLTTFGVASAGMVLGTFAPAEIAYAQENTSEKSGGSEEKPVQANEDLMREHGILRRALLIYTETVPKLRSDPASIPPDALYKTAKLFRTFGENYHESILEEKYIFPRVRKLSGRAAQYPTILERQHDRGREITSYILAVSNAPRIASGNAEPLARTLESFVLMYQNHAAREDTIVFPAWKEALSMGQYNEVGEKFEEIEQQQFGQDGFDWAEQQVSEVEQVLGLADLAQFTPPPPPAAE